MHGNVTVHPTAAWTLQQLREAIPWDHRYRFLIHDGDEIFSPQLDQSITPMGLRVLKTPPRSPKANSLCERVIGTLRRECLHFVIPVSENHLRLVTKNWSRITIAVDPMPASGQESLIRHSSSLSRQTDIAIGFQATVRL